MNIIEAIEIFNLIYDQYGREEGILEVEVCRHLNSAITLVMTDHFYNKHKKRQERENPPYGFEINQYSTHDFAKLLVPDMILEPDTTGKVNYSTITADFPQTIIRREEGEIETRKCNIFHFASVLRWDPAQKDHVECKWCKDNNHPRNKKNPFRQATDAYPYYRLLDAYLQVYPQAENQLILTPVREHRFVWYDPNDQAGKVDFELSERATLAVILRSLQLAGVSMRDQELYRMIQNEVVT